MSKITEINPLPKEVEAWVRCRLLHTKRPERKNVWLESIQDWAIEIVWVCDECNKDIKPS